MPEGLEPTSPGRGIQDQPGDPDPFLHLLHSPVAEEAVSVVRQLPGPADEEGPPGLMGPDREEPGREDAGELAPLIERSQAYVWSARNPPIPSWKEIRWMATSVATTMMPPDGIVLRLPTASKMQHVYMHPGRCAV